MERERVRERDQYDQALEYYRSLKEQREKGKVVIRGDELPWEENRQGRIKFYVNRRNEHELSAGGWSSFIHDIRRHSGMHRHQGGLSLFVIEGEGYTVVNGQQFDWEAGDLIMLPIQPGGCEHQHFNHGGTASAKWLSLIYTWGMMPLANDMVQRQESPEYQAREPAPEASQTAHSDSVDETPTAVRHARTQTGAPWRGTGTLFDALLEQRDVERQRIAGARMVVKGAEIKPEVNPMGIFHWYAHPSMKDIGCRTTLIYVQEIPPGSRSGVQLHQGGRLHYVWQGRGHSIIDGIRYDWQEGDEILLPLKFDGVVHQHFNNGRDPVKLVCAEGNVFDTLGVDLGSGFEVLEPCPEYTR